MSQLILSIDASTETPCILLCDGNEILDFHLLNKRSSDSLAKAVEERLQAVGRLPSDLKEVRAGVGPGSYTGIRAAMSFAAALAYSLGIEAHGFCALGALAPRAASRSASKVVPNVAETHIWPVAIDARSAGIWGAFATWENGQLMLSPPERVSTDELEAWVKSGAKESFGIWSLEPEKLAKKLENTSLQAIPSTLNKLTLRDLALSSPLPLTPNYLGKGHNKEPLCKPPLAPIG